MGEAVAPEGGGGEGWDLLELTGGLADVRSPAMTRLFFLAVLFLQVQLSGLQAARVIFEPGGNRGHQFVLSDGATRLLPTTVDSSSAVQVGYLAVEGDATSFQLFAESVISVVPILALMNPLTTTGGMVYRISTDNPAGTCGVSVLANKKLVLWVFGQNGEQGMFTSNTWTVPPDLGISMESYYSLLLAPNAPPSVTTIPLPGFYPSAFASPVSSTIGGTTNTQGHSYILGSPIPEPSALALAGVAATWAFQRRRRAKSGPYFAK